MRNTLLKQDCKSAGSVGEGYDLPVTSRVICIKPPRLAEVLKRHTFAQTFSWKCEGLQLVLQRCRWIQARCGATF